MEVTWKELNNKMCEFYDIKDCLSDLDEVIDIIYGQWGSFFRKSKQERMNEFLNAINNNLKFPRLYVMKSNDSVIGTFTIKEMNIDGQSLPSVWYLIIKPQFRGMGYGRKLLEFLKRVCEDKERVYLLTQHAGFYEKIGFEFVKNMEHNGQTDRLYMLSNHHKMNGQL